MKRTMLILKIGGEFNYGNETLIWKDEFPAFQYRMEKRRQVSTLYDTTEEDRLITKEILSYEILREEERDYEP